MPPSASPRVYTPQLLAVFVATVGYFAVAGLSFPVLPRLVEQELGGGSAEIGLSFGVFALGMLLARPIAGALSDRLGRRTMMISGAAMVGAAQLLHVPAADTGELWVLLGVRVLTGAGSSAMYLALATVATELPAAEHRDRVFTTFSSTILIGFSIGQVFGEIVMETAGFAWAYVLGAGFAVATVLTAVTLPETKPAEVVPASNFRELFHPAGVRIGVVNLLVFVGFMGFNAFIADYAEEFGLDEVRWLLLTYSITVLAMRAAGARVFTRFARRSIATFSHSLVVVGALLLATAGSAGQLYVASFVLGVGMAWNIPLLILIAVDSATEVDRSKVVATVTVFGDLANSAGTLALGYLAAGVGYDGMYLAIACSAALAVALVRSPFLSAMPGLVRPGGSR